MERTKIFWEIVGKKDRDPDFRQGGRDEVELKPPIASVDYLIFLGAEGKNILSLCFFLLLPPLEVTAAAATNTPHIHSVMYEYITCAHKFYIYNLCQGMES